MCVVLTVNDVSVVYSCISSVCRRAYFYALPYSLVVAPRGEAVIEGGGGATLVASVCFCGFSAYSLCVEQLRVRCV